MDDVSAFYERHPYPPPSDDLDAYRRTWGDARRRADSHLFWPAQPYRDDRNVLVAGCGTMQAAHYAARWPEARVVGIDVSAASIEFERQLAKQHALENLDLHVLPVERALELGETFDHVVCTGVIHHLSDPQAGLRALRGVLAPGGAIYLMVYAPYGRGGIYMLQDYCRRLGIGPTDPEIRDLALTLRAIPQDHPLAPLLMNSPDFATAAGLADALLHPRDRSFNVTQLFELVADADLQFGRWLRQAPYLASCGSISATPHRARLEALDSQEQYAAVELLRGTMTRHSIVAYAREFSANGTSPDFTGKAWLDYVPIRLPGTIAVHENLPAGAAAVLINRGHTYTDLYLPVTETELRMRESIDGERTIGEICAPDNDSNLARVFFTKLWQWDQAVFDMSEAN